MEIFPLSLATLRPAAALLSRMKARLNSCSFNVAAFRALNQQQMLPQTRALLTRWTHLIVFWAASLEVKQKRRGCAQSAMACTLLHNLKMQHSLIVSLTSSAETAPCTQRHLKTRFSFCSASFYFGGARSEEVHDLF